MPRREQHWDCRSKGTNKDWVALYVRDPDRRSFVRVGRVCPACGKVEEAADQIHSVFARD